MDLQKEMHVIGMSGYDRGFRDGVEIVIEGLEVLAHRGEIQPLPRGIIEGLRIVATWNSKMKSPAENSTASG